ncbi:hypothetical protein MHH52_00510 [Paenibacillus sp. FSL K6-0276]|uniref:GMP synthase (glutamine-hydrolyzing) n=1 Tax=Paenibacillus sp. FSL K6-0276 TaxID=2921450 RepID=UPI0030EEF764
MALIPRIPWDVLEKISVRIVNEVENVNCVVYDINSKPPATIEWEELVKFNSGRT